jgi:hypothetical protein
MLDNEYERYELEEMAGAVGEYFSSVTGRNIEVGIDEDDDYWISSSRTNGREYFESLEAVEDRLKALYSDLFQEDDYEAEAL